MIIGKGGETIKRLAAESGAKIQFKPDGLFFVAFFFQLVESITCTVIS